MRIRPDRFLRWRSPRSSKAKGELPRMLSKNAPLTDAVGDRVLLDAGRHVHPVADQAITLDHHVGKMKSEAQPERIGLHALTSGKGTADLGRAAQDMDRAAELRQPRIPGRVEDPPA